MTEGRKVKAIDHIRPDSDLHSVLGAARAYAHHVEDHNIGGYPGAAREEAEGIRAACDRVEATFRKLRSEGREPDAEGCRKCGRWVGKLHDRYCELGPGYVASDEVAPLVHGTPSDSPTGEPWDLGELHDEALHEAALAVMQHQGGGPGVPPFIETRIAVETYNRYVADRRASDGPEREP